MDSNQESEQPAEHVALAVERVILCVKYVGVQSKAPQERAGIGPGRTAMWLCTILDLAVP